MAGPMSGAGTRNRLVNVVRRAFVLLFTTRVEQAGDRQREWEEDQRELCCELGEDLCVYVLL